MQPPELKGFMDKKLSSKSLFYFYFFLLFISTASFHKIIINTNLFPFSTKPNNKTVKLNANRHVTGVLRGFDQFMNIVLDNTIDEKSKVDIGMVVVRGNSIITIEALESIDKD